MQPQQLQQQTQQFTISTNNKNNMDREDIATCVETQLAAIPASEHTLLLFVTSGS